MAEAVGSLCALDAEAAAAVAAQVADLGREGLRVLAVTHTTLREDAHSGAPPSRSSSSSWASVGLEDPVRAGVPAAVAEWRGAGCGW